MTMRIAQRITIAAAAAALAVLPLAAEAGMNTPDDKFVRTANYYLRAGTDITPSLYPELAKYDLLVFPAEAQVYNPSLARELRRLNPDIVILAYVPTKSWNDAWFDPLHRDLGAGIDEAWWLHSSDGSVVSVWQGTRMLNAVSGWQTYLPQFVHDRIMSTGFWDGVFYDEFSANVSWVNGGDIDIHNDGIRDSSSLADVAWQRSMENLLRRTRNLLGTDAVIVTNGDSTGSLQEFVNGRMFESFPTPWEAGGTWQGVMANYLHLHDMVGYTPVFIINATTGNTGWNTDYRGVRFGLGSTLLADGFFSYDFGEQDHGQLWWYDEMDTNLGRPLGSAMNADSPSDATVRAGVWRRDFERGAVIVNSTKETRTVRFDQDLEKLRGTQDPKTNDGSIVSSMTLAPEDGIILLKPVERIAGSPFVNGAFARIYDMDGTQERNGFFAYESPYDGGASVALMDLEGDGSEERLVGEDGVITIYGADGKARKAFHPYGDAYTGPVNFAVGDLEGDGYAEIVTGAGPGGGPHVRVFNRDGKLINPGFFAYDPMFRGGVHVAVGDIYGTGKDVIIVGAGDGGGPHVRVFNKYGRLLNPGFFAYDPMSRGGVNVAVGDLDGDGIDEIVTGAGPGGSPEVKVFTSSGRQKGTPFYSGDRNGRNGVAVAVTDINSDGRGEIAALSSDVFQFTANR